MSPSYRKLGEMKRMFDVPTTIVTSRSDRKRKLSSIDDFDLHNGDDEHVTSPKVNNISPDKLNFCIQVNQIPNLHHCSLLCGFVEKTS
jgi:hypothetical protein